MQCEHFLPPFSFLLSSRFRFVIFIHPFAPHLSLFLYSGLSVLCSPISLNINFNFVFMFFRILVSLLSRFLRKSNPLFVLWSEHVPVHSDLISCSDWLARLSFSLFSFPA